MNQTERANRVAAINMKNDLLKKGVTKETADAVITAYRKATEESEVIRSDNRTTFREDFPKREMEICEIPDYVSYDYFSEYRAGISGGKVFRYHGELREKYLFAARHLPAKPIEGNAAILHDFPSRIEGYTKDRFKAVEKRREIREAKTYLNTPYAKEWLRKMQFTTREDEYGHKFLFLAILAGYEKIEQYDFSDLCNALSMVYFGHRLSVGMYIGGKVNWTMFYERPDHVDGHETYFSGVVAQDDFSPEDFDRDHSDYSFANAKHHL